MEPIVQLAIYIAGLLVTAISTYLAIARRTNETVTESTKAQTAQQNLITKRFDALLDERVALQARIDALELAKDASDAEIVRVCAELAETKHTAEAHQAALKTAQDKAALLEVDVKALTEKVTALESERKQRADELQRERAQVQTTKRELTTANEKITQLQERVRALELENGAFKLLLDKIQVVRIDPDPDPPSAPASMHIESSTTTTAISTTTTDTEEGAA